MICKKCGHEYDDTMNFCPNCGFKKDGQLIKEKKNIDYQKLVNILNIILFGLSILFTFIWLMTYSNSSTINVFLTLSSIAAIFSTFYLLSQGISLLFLLLNKDKKIDKKLLIAYIMLSVLAFILFITNLVYFSDFVTIKSFLR